MSKIWKITIGAAVILITLSAVFCFLRGTDNPLDATYLIEGSPVTLENGRSETEIVPGSASKQITTVLWAPTKGGLNSDKRDDYAMILTQNFGGSGTFYYIVAGIGSWKGITGTNGIFLGDRIAPENISISNGEILVNYAERKADDPMTAQPSVGVSKYLVLKDGLLIEK